MRKRKVYEHWEDAIDALTPDERRRLLWQLMADRQANYQLTDDLDEPRPTLH